MAATFGHNVRIYVPFDGDKYPIKTISDGVGHYELQLGGSMVLLGNTYVDPVISYDKAKNGTYGTITICNGAYMTNRANRLLCYYDIKLDMGDLSASEERVAMAAAINSWLEEAGCELSEQDKETGRKVYKVTKGTFATYSLENANCFIATAQWCKLLGDNALYNEWQSAGTNFEKYTAWPMFLKHRNGWHLLDLNV